MKEIIQDLFSVDDSYFLAHCISADARMGAGIAVEFVKRFPQITRLRNDWQTYNAVGTCRKIGRVFNLITKYRAWDKPTYGTLTRSLEDMKLKAIEKGVAKIAMPRIGCGLDGLQWHIVRNVIEDVFDDTEIEILICKPEQGR